MAAGDGRLKGGTALVVLLAAIPLFYAWATGAVAIPHNDDWAFLRIVFDLVRTGELRLVGWNEMTLVGHLIWAYPLVALAGENIALLDSTVALWSIAGILMSIALARRFVAPGHAIAVAGLVAVFPGYLQTTVSYMTDPVAYVAQLGCLLLGLAGIRTGGARGQRLVIASLGVGLFAFAVREFGIIAPLAVGFGAILEQARRKQIRAATVASVVVFVAAAIAFYGARQALPGGTPHTFGAPGLERLLVVTSQSVFTLGLGVSPVLAYLVRRRPEVLVSCLNAGALLGLGLAALALHSSADITTCCYGGRPSVFVGNALTEHGNLGNQVLLGTRPRLFPEAMWLLMSALGVAGGVLGMGWLWSSAVRWFKENETLESTVITLLFWGLGTGWAIVTRASLGGPLFDRYLIVPLVVASIFALRSLPVPDRSRPSLGALAIYCLLTVASMVVVTDGLSYDLARWRAGQWAVREGTPIDAVDAGFEWVGYHYEGVVKEPLPPVTPRMGPGYLEAFPATGNCVVVSASPLDEVGLLLVHEVPYASWFGLRRFELSVYRNEPACQQLGLT